MILGIHKFIVVASGRYPYDQCSAFGTAAGRLAGRWSKRNPSRKRGTNLPTLRYVSGCEHHIQFARSQQRKKGML